MVKKKKVSSTRIAMFAVGMVIGLGLIIFDQFETIEGFVSGTETPSLAILDVPIDPTSGGIIGTIVFGAPDVVPFERSGALITADNLGNCIVAGSAIGNTVAGDYLFGRQLSGDRNVSPIWHGYNGINCAIAYMEWDLVDIPNDFVATGIRLQFEINQLPSKGAQSSSRCGIIHIEDSFDQIGQQQFMNRATSIPRFIDPTGVQGLPNTNPLDFRVTGLAVNFVDTADWCQSLGVKSFAYGKIIPPTLRSDGTLTRTTFDVLEGARAFNRALTDGQDKFTIAFIPEGTGSNTGSGTWGVNYDYWKTQGSLLVTGSSPPIRCGIGFTQVDFRCEPLICITGQKVDTNTNSCEDIQCSIGEELQGNLCVPVVCSIGEKFNNATNSCETIICQEGTQLIGSTCDPLLCEEGFEISGNQCTLKMCGVGMELIGDNCQMIQCTTPNTILVGSDCMERSCPMDQVLVDGVCRTLQPVGDIDPAPIECLSGFTPVGNTCVQLPENCPIGSVAQENICVQVLPDLMISQAPELGTLTIVGIVIFGGSFFGLVGSRRV